MVDEARRLGVPDTAMPLTVEQVQARCASPAMRGGVFLPEGANVHPGRLVRSLRKAALELGVAVHEDSPVLSLHKSAPSELSTREARVVAQDVVMASNVSLAADPALQPHLCVFSSYALMTEPAPQALARQGWHGDEGFSDFRMFLHYFRKTPDGRVLMGSGSGPIAMTGNSNDPRLSSDGESLDRTISGLRRLLPALAEVGVSASWGGALDVSTDRLPFFGTFPGSRVHYGCGYSGHGLNATWIGGQCLASLVLGQRDEWTASPFCTRALSRFPPEPWRTFGGRAIRWGILRCEEAAEEGMQGPWMARTLASAPEKLGMKIGTR
jgi:glycine/D-amino acid oxidase-like deaminating enzyme